MIKILQLSHQLLKCILTYFVLIYREEPCSKVSVYSMRTALLDEMNKMVSRIVENEQEAIKLSMSIEQKKLELRKKKESTAKSYNVKK